jgi:hypothetical protein
MQLKNTKNNMVNITLIIFFINFLNTFYEINPFDKTKNANINIELGVLDFDDINETKSIFGIDEAEKELFKTKIKKSIIKYLEEFGINENKLCKTNIMIEIRGKKITENVCEKNLIIWIKIKLNGYDYFPEVLFLSKQEDLENDIIEKIKKIIYYDLKNKRNN